MLQVIKDLLPQSGYKPPQPKLWIARHYNYLFRYASKRIDDDDLIRDLVQETFLIGLENLAKFEGRSTERTWLTGILNNLIFVTYKQRRAANQIFTYFGNDPVVGTSFSEEDNSIKLYLVHEPIDDQENEMEFRNKLHHGIRMLPALWRTIFIMKYIEDTPVMEICRQLNISPSNYWIIRHRAKAKAQSFLSISWCKSDFK